MTPRMSAVTRNTAVVVLAAVVAGAVGFGAGAQLRGLASLSFLSNVGTILLAAIPALAAYIRGGRIQREVSTIREQTNGQATAMANMTGRAVEALAAIADDKPSAQRAAQLLRRIAAAAEPALPPDPDPPPPVIPSPPRLND
jgi:hypothetical protein